MSESNEAAFAALHAIADRLQPHQELLGRAWARFFAATVNGAQELEILKQVIDQVNRAIEVEAPAIAKATGNAVTNIHTFRPRGIDAELKVWFDDHYPADFLRCVAQYRSFSVSFWKTRGWKGFSATPAISKVPA